MCCPGQLDLSLHGLHFRYLLSDGKSGKNLKSINTISSKKGFKMNIRSNDWIATRFEKGPSVSDIPATSQASPALIQTAVSRNQSAQDAIRKQKKRKGFAATRVADNQDSTTQGSTVLSQTLGGY